MCALPVHMCQQSPEKSILSYGNEDGCVLGAEPVSSTGTVKVSQVHCQ